MVDKPPVSVFPAHGGVFRVTPGVGLEMQTPPGGGASTWLSWQETQAFARWLAGLTAEASDEAPRQQSGKAVM